MDELENYHRVGPIPPDELYLSERGVEAAEKAFGKYVVLKRDEQDRPKVTAVLPGGGSKDELYTELTYWENGVPILHFTVRKPC